jgi:hypothetical protein
LKYARSPGVAGNRLAAKTESSPQAFVNLLVVYRLPMLPIFRLAQLTYVKSGPRAK